MKRMFKSIYQFVDKYIVMPISRFVYFLNKNTKKHSGKLDKLLNSQKFLMYLSLFLAVATFLVIDSRVIKFVESQAESISNVPVVVKYNTEAYVVEGAPEFVDITITGRKSDIYLAKQLGEYEVVLDLTDYVPRENAYKVYFNYSKSIDNLTYKLDPSYVSVVIKNKISDTALITPELLNLDKLDPKLSVKSVTLDKSEVVVKGSKTSLAKIATVKGLVDLNDTALIEAGTYNIDNVKLVAYDNVGKIIPQVEMVPRNVGATVTLDSYSKTVPLEVRTTGSLIAGKAISAIQINGTTKASIAIYGDKKEIDEINSVPLTINVDGAGKESVKDYNVTISKPSGVRHMDLKSAKISVTFGDEEQKTINIYDQISQKNLSADLAANIISQKEITVQAKGVAATVAGLSASDVVAYVDLKGLSIGEHEVEVKIDNKNPLVTYVVSSTVTIKITQKPKS